LIKRAKKSKTQESIAVIIAKRYCEIDHFARMEAYISEKLSFLECVYQEEYFFTFFIHLVEQYALIKDQFAPKRVTMQLLRFKD
jgi:hypothetical protein